MTGIFHGWWVVASLFVVLMASSGLGFYSLPIFVRVLSDSGLFSVHTVSTASGLFFVVTGVGGMAVARLLGRFDVRWVITGGGVLGALSLLGVGHVTVRSELFGVYALFGLGFAATSLVPAMTLVTRWFTTHRSIAISIVSTGLSVGGIAVAPVCARFAERHDLATVTPWLALAYLVGTIPLTWLLVRDHPRPQDPCADGDHHGNTGTSRGRVEAGTSYADAVRSRFFLWLGVGYVLLMAAQVGAMMHVYNLSALRVDPGFARTCVAVVAFSSVVGRFSGGFALTRLPARSFGAVLIALQSLALSGIAESRDASWLLAWIVAFGISVGNLLMLQPLLLADAFGVRDYARIYALSGLITTLGYAAGPEVMGASFDCFGGYREAFLLASGSSLMGLVAFLLAGPPAARPAPAADLLATPPS